MSRIIVFSDLVELFLVVWKKEKKVTGFEVKSVETKNFLLVLCLLQHDRVMLENPNEWLMAINKYDLISLCCEDMMLRCHDDVMLWWCDAIMMWYHDDVTPWCHDGVIPCWCDATILWCLDAVMSWWCDAMMMWCHDDVIPCWLLMGWHDAVILWSHIESIMNCHHTWLRCNHTNATLCHGGVMPYRYDDTITWYNYFVLTYRCGDILAWTFCLQSYDALMKGRHCKAKWPNSF